MEPTPCWAWISRKPEAMRAMASAQDTTRHSSSMVSRTIGSICRSWWEA